VCPSVCYDLKRQAILLLFGNTFCYCCYLSSPLHIRICLLLLRRCSAVLPLVSHSKVISLYKIMLGLLINDAIYMEHIFCALKLLVMVCTYLLFYVMSGQYGSHGTLGKEMLSESKLKDLLHGSEYVLTYEDKDGDWMLVGDVPWE
jgi:hypothetical protein